MANFTEWKNLYRNVRRYPSVADAARFVHPLSGSVDYSGRIPTIAGTSARTATAEIIIKSDYRNWGRTGSGSPVTYCLDVEGDFHSSRTHPGISTDCICHTHC
jgi:hypothetical protein